MASLQEGTGMNSFSRGDEMIYITHLPGLKKPCLAVGNKCVVRKVATFNTEEDAEEFCAMLKSWLGLEDREEAWQKYWRDRGCTEGRSR